MVSKFIANLNNFIEYFDRDGNEICDQTIYKEYQRLLEIMSIYPKLKPKRLVIIHIIHFSFVNGLLMFMIFINTVTAVCAGKDDFPTMAHSIVYVLMIIIFWICYNQMVFSRSNVAIMHTILGQNVYDYMEQNNDIPEAIKAKYVRTKKRINQIVAVVSMLLAMFIVCVGPLLNNTEATEITVQHPENGINYDLPIPLWLPFEASHGFPYFVAVAYIAVTFTYVFLIYSAVSAIFYNVAMTMVCQLEILIKSINNIEKRAIIMYKRENNFSKLPKTLDKLYESFEFQNMIEICLKQNIQHHQQLLRLRKAITETIDCCIIVIYMVSGIVIALTVHTATTVSNEPGTVLTFGCLSSLFILAIAGDCFMGQLLSNLNEKLRIEIYSTKWRLYSKSTKKLIGIMQQFTCRDFNIKVPFNVTLNLEFYGRLMNTTYSYLSVLIAMNK